MRCDGVIWWSMRPVPSHVSFVVPAFALNRPPGELATISMGRKYAEAELILVDGIMFRETAHCRSLDR